MEAALILLGVISLLSILTLRHGAAGTTSVGSPSLITAGPAILAVYDGTSLLGQSRMPVLTALCSG
jgi:hypothetical protein